MFIEVFVVTAMTRTAVVDGDGDDTRQTGNGYGNSTAAAEWSFGASSQYFRSRPINRLYWTSYDIIYYIIMLLCAMDSDSGAARALFIIAVVVVVAYTMSVLIELVNCWARRKLRCTYLYRHTGTVLYYNMRTHKLTLCSRVSHIIIQYNNSNNMEMSSLRACRRPCSPPHRDPITGRLAHRRRRRGEPETWNGGENNNLVIVVSHLL